MLVGDTVIYFALIAVFLASFFFSKLTNPVVPALAALAGAMLFGLILRQDPFGAVLPLWISFFMGPVAFWLSEEVSRPTHHEKKQKDEREGNKKEKG